MAPPSTSLRLAAAIPSSYKIVFTPGTSDDAQDDHILWASNLQRDRDPMYSGASDDRSMRNAYSGVFDDHVIQLIEEADGVCCSDTVLAGLGG